jgi:hypothetical protein
MSRKRTLGVVVSLGRKPTVRVRDHVPGKTRYYGQARGTWDPSPDGIHHVRDDGALAVRDPKTGLIVEFDAFPGKKESDL